MDVVLEVMELDPGDGAQARGHELLEPDHTGAAALGLGQGGHLRGEVGVVTDQEDVILAVQQGLGGALDGQIHHLALAAQGHRPVPHGQQRLHEWHGHAVIGGQEEQAVDGLLPHLLGVLDQPVPARTLLRVRAAAEDRASQGGIDVLSVHQQVGGAFAHVLEPTRLDGVARRGTLLR